MRDILILVKSKQLFSDSFLLQMNIEIASDAA